MNPEAKAPVKVLIVDDEEAILFTLKRILQAAGYEVQTAHSGSEGLQLFQQSRWDLVTLDRSMPEMNGEEVATAMRHIAPHVPLVLITGFPGAVQHPKLFDAVVPKPFRSTELIQCFTKVLAERPSSAGAPPPQARMAGSCSI